MSTARAVSLPGSTWAAGSNGCRASAPTGSSFAGWSRRSRRRRAEPVIEPVPVTDDRGRQRPPAARGAATTAMRTTASMPAPVPPPMPRRRPCNWCPVQVILPDTLPRRTWRLPRPAPIRPASPRSTSKQHRARMHQRPRAPSPDWSTAPTIPLRAPITAPSPGCAWTDRAAPGYANVWTDGRLNPYRGIRTVEGDAQMRMVWTDTVPRRLVASE
jgi:hypothetical protein